MVAKRHAHSLKFNESNLPIGFDENDDIYATWLYENLNQILLFRVFNAQNVTLLSSKTGNDIWLALQQDNVDVSLFSSFTHENDVFYTVTESIYRDGEEYFFQVAMSKELYVFMNKCFAIPRVLAGIIVFSVVFFFVFVMCSGTTLRWAVKPLEDISKESARISPTSISDRLNSENVPHEISSLVASFNEVLERVELGFRSQQEFLTKVAHELKTPLALIRAQIELNEIEVHRATLLCDVDHMTRQVQQLIMLAEVCEIQNYCYRDQYVDNIIVDVADFLLPLARSVSVDIHIEGQSEKTWRIDESAFFILIKNLIENAIQHSPQYSSVVVVLEENTINVRDYGTGIQEKDTLHVFERFWRGEHRRDLGAGLGLAICREIAQAHGFNLSLKNENPGVSFKIARNN